MKIQRVHAREILDSRGQPTVEVDVLLESGAQGRAAVPSGASCGQREALELRDADQSRYFGKGVLQAVKHVNEIIAPQLKGQHDHPQSIDALLINLDGTPDKSKLGANAILAVSMAMHRAHAAFEGVPLYHYLNPETGLMPTPLMNFLNGGVHANNAMNIQEVMIAPVGATSFQEALRWGAELYHSLKSRLKKQGESTCVGDEGGFAPHINTGRAALELLMDSMHDVGFTPGRDIALALDVAASECYRQNHYQLEGTSLTAEAWIDCLESWVNDFPLISIEDPLAENDEEAWASITERLGGRVQLVADDLFVTNPKIIQAGIDKNLANAVLIKPNQIGTISETLEAIALARKHHYAAIISHRSGETEDTFIADLAVASGVGQIKTGAPCRSDRVAKYNQLLRIEEETMHAYAKARTFRCAGM